MKRKDKKRNTFRKCFSRMKEKRLSRKRLEKRRDSKILELKKNTPEC